VHSLVTWEISNLWNSIENYLARNARRPERARDSRVPRACGHFPRGCGAWRSLTRSFPRVTPPSQCRFAVSGDLGVHDEVIAAAAMAHPRHAGAGIPGALLDSLEPVAVPAKVRL
jgi:hypothetical protein